MWTLGINGAFHDTAAALICDGVVIAAAEEERFTHYKHGKRPLPFTTWELPYHAIEYCLRAAGLKITDIEHIAYSFDPRLIEGQSDSQSDDITRSDFGVYKSWDSLFLQSIKAAPDILRSNVPHHLELRFRGIQDARFEWHFVDHHIAHAASAFQASPFDEAAVVTLDGRGEVASTTYSLGMRNDLERIGQVNIPHSLGLLYEEVTEYLGFLRSSDEYKVMALASFGRPRYVDDFREMIQLGEAGQYRIERLALEDRFGPRRPRASEYEPRHFDIAHSLQVVLEERTLDLLRWLHGAARQSAVSGAAQHLCLAGGVALNCVLNARLRDRGPFRSIWVQPAAGDAGTALGAALWIDARERRSSTRSWCMRDVYLGPGYSDQEIEDFLKWSKVPYREMSDIAGETAELLSRDKIIGWFQGRMEFGPRALGSRSILASPLNAEMQDRLNEVKDREDFRPVAPVVLEDDAAEWFKGATVSPFMLFVFDVEPERGDRIPAVRHTDGTARVQTINRDQNARYYDLLAAFKKRTGVPILVNTSFNSRGKPIVCTPQDAVECFFSTPLDALVIGSFVLEKA